MNQTSDSITKRKYYSSYITTIISISLVLFTIGVISVILLNAQRLSQYAKENIGFSVFILDDQREADILQLQKTLDKAEYVKETKFVSKEEAAEILRKDLGDDFVDFLGFNPLLASIEIALQADYATVDSIGTIETELLKNPIVKEVYYQKSLIQAVNNNVRKISIVLIVMALVFFLISVILINNTIRLSLYSKRTQIHTMQLVGATDAFIRKPFIVQTGFAGFISALIAVFVLVFFALILQQELNEFITFQDLGIVLIVLVVVGILISAGSAYYSLQRYLKGTEE